MADVTQESEKGGGGIIGPTKITTNWGFELKTDY